MLWSDPYRVLYEGLSKKDGMDLIRSMRHEAGLPLPLNDSTDCGVHYHPEGENVDDSLFPKDFELPPTVGRNKITDDDGYRPFEPVIDLQYVGELKEKDEDLRPLTIRVQPEELKGTVEMKSTKDGLRFWSKASQGRENRLQSVADEGETFKVSQLPTTLYVEGVKVGSGNEFSVTSNLKASNGSAQRKKRMEAHVISMELIDQEQRLIYEYNSSIKFKLSGQPFDLETDDNYEVYDYRWWDGEKFTGVRSSQIRVRYGDEEPDDDDVFVPLKPEAKNRRKMYNVGVKIRKRERTLLTLMRKIRVALDSCEGTKLETDDDPSKRQNDVEAIGAVFADPDPLPTPGGDENVKGSQDWYHGEYGLTKSIDDNRIQYAPKASSYGVVPAPTREKKDGQYEFFHYHVILIGTGHYPDGTLENMKSTIAHENRHVKQFLQMRTNGQDGLMPNGSKPKNVWKSLFEYYEHANKSVHLWSINQFMEADAYMESVVHEKSDWLKKRNSFNQLRENYRNARLLSSGASLFVEINNQDIPVPPIEDDRLKGAARRLLQMTYLRAFGDGEGGDTIFPELGYRGVDGAPSYNYHIRPPRAEQQN